MLVGIALDHIARGDWSWAGFRVQSYAPLVLLAWLAIPLVVFNTWNPVQRLRETARAEASFARDVMLLRTLPGPALCESLLRCYFAGKPYDYDPFNATRLVQFHKLDEDPLVEALQEHKYGAVQWDMPREDAFSERFTPAVAAAIQQNYRPVQRSDEAVIFVPR